MAIHRLLSDATCLSSQSNNLLFHSLTAVIASGTWFRLQRPQEKQPRRLVALEVDCPSKKQESKEMRVQFPASLQLEMMHLASWTVVTQTTWARECLEICAWPSVDFFVILLEVLYAHHFVSFLQ